MGNILNLVYDKFYYSYSKRYKEKDNRFPCPNGYDLEFQEDFMLFMKYYEDNKMHSHLVNSTFDGKYYKKIDILKNKDVPNPKVKIHFPFLTSDLCKNFDLVYHDATNDELNEDLYFYVIELIHFDIDYFESMFNDISDKVKNLINEGRCKVIVDFGHEGQWNSLKFYEWYQEFLHKSEIDLNQIYIFICDLNYDTKLFTDYKINFVSSLYYLEELSRGVSKIISKGIIESTIGHKYSILDIDDIDVNKKNKYFLSLMRNCGKFHRQFLGCYFEFNDLWDDNIISFLKGSWNNNFRPKIPVKYSSVWDKLDKGNPIEIDTHEVENKYGFSPYYTDREDFYKETFLSVVTEVLFDHDSIFLSEKILKPIWNLHPFIVASVPFTLKKLKELGFKTFEPFIDESYDKEKNHVERMNKITTELDKFRSKSFDELRVWWKEILPILSHNQKVFLEYKDKKTSKTKFFEKFV